MSPLLKASYAPCTVATFVLCVVVIATSVHRVPRREHYGNYVLLCSRNDGEYCIEHATVTAESREAVLTVTAGSDEPITPIISRLRQCRMRVLSTALRGRPALQGDEALTFAGLGHQVGQGVLSASGDSFMSAVTVPSGWVTYGT